MGPFEFRNSVLQSALSSGMCFRINFPDMIMIHGRINLGCGNVRVS